MLLRRGDAYRVERMPIPEAPLRETRFGLVADEEGWFVLNARDSRWRDTGRFGVFCTFEGKRRFRELGLNLNVLEPGQSLGLYHRERAQEGFLVLAGECVLLVEGEERALRPWDFVHCPAGTAHMIVGGGSGPSLVLAVGARPRRNRVVYPVEPAALARGVGVERETTKAAEAYGSFADWKRCAYREGWLPE
jgi:uncharacterized cupin superfamily protein